MAQSFLAGGGMGMGLMFCNLAKTSMIEDGENSAHALAGAADL